MKHSDKRSATFCKHSDVLANVLQNVDTSCQRCYFLRIQDWMDRASGETSESDIVMVFQDGVDVEFLCEAVGSGYAHMEMGEPYANLIRR